MTRSNVRCARIRESLRALPAPKSRGRLEKGVRWLQVTGTAYQLARDQRWWRSPRRVPHVLAKGQCATACVVSSARSTDAFVGRTAIDDQSAIVNAIRWRRLDGALLISIR